MIAKDVMDKVRQTIGSCSDVVVFEYLSDAVEILAHKGDWDPLVCYLDIPTTSGNEVVLPDFVDAILRVNINRKPAFSRGRLFEFKQNTDGTVIGNELGYTWADRGYTPVTTQPVAPSQLSASAADALRVYGNDVSGQPIYTNGELGYAVTNGLAGPTFKKITGVKKFATSNYVTLNAGATAIATYEPREYEPSFRVIKISQATAAVRLMVRRKTYVVSNQWDWIPLSSRIAITYMVKSLFLARSQTADIKEIMYFDKAAVQFLTEEQESRNRHSTISDETEVVTIRNANYETSDCTTVSDIYDQAADIFGGIGREKLFDRITDSVSLLTNESNWDGLTGWIDIAPANKAECEFTLPTWVETALKINIGGCPTTGYNRWFQFHRNGPGQHGRNMDSWEDQGGFPTVKDIVAPASLVAIVDTALDNNTQVRVLAFDTDGNEIFTDGERGMIIPALHGNVTPDPNLPKVSRIVGVIKEKTIGYVRVIAYEDGATEEKIISLFRPEDTMNTYRRVKINRGTSTIRALVRKKTYRVSSLADIIPICDRNALVLAMRAKKAMDTGDLQSAQDHRKLAVDLLENEQEAKNPKIAPSVEFDPTTAPGSIELFR